MTDLPSRPSSTSLSETKWVLYDYYRSSAAYRVRIALNYKNLAYQSIPINLIKNGGEQFSDAYKKVNPQHLVPTLQTDQIQLSQSLAIIEFLEEHSPAPSLLTGDAHERALIRAFSYSICCDIHPLNNLRVQQYLIAEMGCSEDQKMQWYREWINRGFTALEIQLESPCTHQKTDYCFSTFSLADVCLIPQIYNAKRFEVDMSPYPRLSAIDDTCSQLECVKRASPDAAAKALDKS